MYAIYRADGFIQQTITSGLITDDYIDRLTALGLSIQEVPDETDIMQNYFEDDILTPKTYFPAVINKTIIQADGLDLCSITDIPSGSRISLNGQEYTITDDIEITSNIPATITIRTLDIKFFPWSVTIQSVLQ